jgi:hypothetical protein
LCFMAVDFPQVNYFTMEKQKKALNKRPLNILISLSGISGVMHALLQFP